MANGTSFTTDDTFFSDISIALPGRLYSINTNTFELRNKTVDTHISNIDCTISEPLDVKKQRNLLHETFQKHLVATSTLPKLQHSPLELTHPQSHFSCQK